MGNNAVFIEKRVPVGIALGASEVGVAYRDDVEIVLTGRRRVTQSAERTLETNFWFYASSEWLHAGVAGRWA